jgi:hypothetical protein
MSFAWVSRIKLASREIGRVMVQSDAQVQSQHSLHDCNHKKRPQKNGLDSQGAAHDHKDEPRSKHCSTPQKGIGAQSIAASQLSIRVMWPLTHGGTTWTQNGYKLSPLMT